MFDVIDGSVMCAKSEPIDGIAILLLHGGWDGPKNFVTTSTQEVSRAKVSSGFFGTRIPNNFDTIDGPDNFFTTSTQELSRAKRSSELFGTKIPNNFDTIDGSISCA